MKNKKMIVEQQIFFVQRYEKEKLMNWRDFKTDPPYDAKEDMEEGYETDWEYCWFVYRYTDRAGGNSGPFCSNRAHRFTGGIFEGYESHMKTSPYSVDWIEVLYWVPEKEVQNVVKLSAPVT